MAAKRSSLGKRLRFEILKRDGFKCVYCGANAFGMLLHVDHVQPVADGGTDDPSNLVTSCADCNLGKSSIPLDETLIPSQSPETLAEHAEQMRSYIEAAKSVQAAREEAIQVVVDRWCDVVDPSGMQRSLATMMGSYLKTHGLHKILEAVDATGGCDQLHSDTQFRRYFLAVLRNMRTRGEV